MKPWLYCSHPRCLNILSVSRAWHFSASPLISLVARRRIVGGGVPSLPSPNVVLVSLTFVSSSETGEQLLHSIGGSHSVIIRTAWPKHRCTCVWMVFGVLWLNESSLAQLDSDCIVDFRSPGKTLSIITMPTTLTNYVRERIQAISSERRPPRDHPTNRTKNVSWSVRPYFPLRNNCGWENQAVTSE